MKLQNTDNKNYKIGIYEKAINKKFSWNEKFKIAKEAGFDFIEISIDETDFRINRLDWLDSKIYNLRDLAISNGMYINSMCLSANRRFPLGSKDLETRQKGLQIIDKALLFAKKLGIRIVQLAGYDEYYNPEDETTKKYFLENMKTVCELAQYYSVQIAFESMDTPFMGSLTKILNVIKTLNLPMLGIYPDIGNLTQFAKENFASEIELSKDKIVAFHFKDTLPTKFKCVPFGQGTVDFVKAFQAIFSIDYYGPYMIEMWNDNNENQTVSENISDIHQAHLFFKEKYEEALNGFKRN